MLNALAAIGVGLDLEIPFATIQQALAGFAGVQRRFQVLRRGRAASRVVDDYGHHPAEIRATLAAAKAGFDRRVVAVFQPHRYTRTLHLRQEFLTAFNQADVLVVMDIYAAGEAPIPGVTRRGSRRGHRAPTATATSPTWAATGARIVDHLCEIVRPGDLVLTLGAGDVEPARPGAARSGSRRRRVAGEDHMLGEIRGEVRFKEPLSFHTSLRIGGPADIFVVPQDVDDIRHALPVRRARAAAGRP